MMLVKYKGLTLIEIMITIMVFGTGILVILAIVTSSLSLGARTRNKTNATMLAKEGLEMMYQIRDTNLDKAQNRGCLRLQNNNGDCDFSMEGTFSGYIVVGAITGSTINPVHIHAVNTSKPATTRLYIWSGSDIQQQYIHNTTNNPSVFYRYITISPVEPRGTETSATVNANVKKITSVVEYSQLGGTGTVILESLIGRTR